ncbi:MAG: hypothetical protein RLZZ171_2588 [Cyanobacteriota bacterium]|jgi:hypothetical protein
MKIKKLIISLDLGASASKGMYSIYENIDDTSPKTTETITMEPEIAKVPIELLEEEQANFARSSPENVAWIAYKAQDEEGIAIGRAAKKYVLSGEQIESVKYQFATDKCLAFIGVIASKHGISDDILEIVLNLLIPSDEKQSRQALEKSIRKRLKRFYFRKKLISCRLSEFNLQIEGIGGLFYRMEQNQECESKIIVVLMLGHRNCSCLVFDKGNFSHDSIRLGYYDYIQNIKERSIGQKIEDLEYVMPQIEKEPERMDFWLGHLIRGHQCSDREQERLKLTEAITISKGLHWQKVSRWLDRKIPNRLDEILIFGGASRGFKQELTQKFFWAENVDWGEETSNELEKFGIEESMLYRFADVFGLHKQYI